MWRTGEMMHTHTHIHSIDHICIVLVINIIHYLEETDVMGWSLLLQLSELVTYELSWVLSPVFIYQLG